MLWWRLRSVWLCICVKIPVFPLTPFLLFSSDCHFLYISNISGISTKTSKKCRQSQFIWIFSSPAHLYNVIFSRSPSSSSVSQKLSFFVSNCQILILFSQLRLPSSCWNICWHRYSQFGRAFRDRNDGQIIVPQSFRRLRTLNIW